MRLTATSRVHRLAAGAGVLVAVGLTATTAGVSAAPTRPALKPVAADAVGTAMTNLVRAAQRYWRPQAMRIELWRSGERVFEHSQGVANDGAPVDERSPMLVGSISKTLTAMTTMRLAQLGKIDIDRPLVEQWTAPVTPADARFAQITPRMLMQHTSGLQSLHGLFFTNLGRGWRPRVARVLGYTLWAKPGAAFRYSTAGPILQAALIEQVTGMTYEEAVRHYVLGPLGVRHAVLVSDSTNLPGRAARYRFPSSNYIANLGPAGGWALAAGDVAKLATALRDGGPLYDDATLQEMRTTLRPTNPYYLWGLGIMVYTRGGRGVGHTGNINYARALMRAYPNGYTLVMQGSVTSAPISIKMLALINSQLAAVGNLP